MSDKARTLMSNTIVVDGLFHALMKDPPPECGIGKNIVDMILFKNLLPDWNYNA